jgi:hypothetical protein
MTRTIFIAAALALAVTLPAAPAQAQAQRTFVSAAGSDSNNCASVTTPCRHFANAYAVTAPNGEIDVLDPANYGSLTITGPVSIEGHGWASSAAVSGHAAITINASGATDKINIIGVVLDGIAIANTTGIQFNSGGSLTVRDSVIRNFTQGGINFQPDASTPSHISVSNTIVSDNGGNGIYIDPLGLGTTTGVLDHVEMENNAGNGLLVSQLVAVVNVTVSDSVSENNTGNGFMASNSTNNPVTVMIRNSTSANNGSSGLNASGTDSTILVTRSTITKNQTGWNGQVVVSYGDNNIDYNGGNNSTPPNPLAYH